MKPRVTPTSLAGVVIIELDCIEDGRGFFMESWHARDFAEAGLDLKFVQECHSRSARRVLRGLHYQDMTAPMSKLVRCTVGSIFDVVVDLRVGSETFGRWFATELTAANKRQLHIPPGFGHGFQVVGDVAEVQYRQTGFYTPSSEGTIAWNDPDISIEWPIANPILSERDRLGRTLKEYLRAPAFRMGPDSRLSAG
jgi:dTDP-4-dehydrorhamnose 3,5-epimerase